MLVDQYNILLVAPIAFLFGICAGSFVTMASYRIPLGKEIVFKPSYCPNCNAKLGIPDLFPLLSWIVQGGKCRHCKTSISIRYPLIEFVLGLSFITVVLLYGLSFNALLMALLVTELAILIVVDLEHYIIPDSVQVALLVTGLTYRVYNGDGFEDIVPGMAAGLLIGLSLHYGYLFLRKKDALGFGDVKFLCVAGSWLPVADFVPFLFLSGVTGVMTGLLWRVLNRGERFPFGPALALSLFINVMMPGLLHKIVL